MDGLCLAPGIPPTSFWLLQPLTVMQQITVAIWSVIAYWFVTWLLISEQMTEFYPLLGWRGKKLSLRFIKENHYFVQAEERREYFSML